MKRWLALLFVLIGLAVSPARATVRPGGLFTDGAVLQRGRSIPVFGTAGEGEAVTVRLGAQAAATATATGGRWRVDLPSLPAGGPYVLVIAGPANVVVLHGILIGEVYVCSGQSNMGFPLAEATGGPEAVARATDPLLHLCVVPWHVSPIPLADTSASWRTSAPDTARNFSAVAFFFGRALRRALGVPVGLIESSIGGTAAELWTGRDALQADPALADLASDQAMAHFGCDSPTSLYNGMIAPLIPYGIRGVIWYQGESDTDGDGPRRYRALFPALIAGWRRAWGEGDFPFLFVQIAPWRKGATGPPGVASVREAQRLTARTVPNTAMVVTVDVGGTGGVHPPDKEPVGRRLALAARALVYGQNVEYSGPMYDAMRVEGGKVVLHFAHARGGLAVRVGPPTGFTLAGPDRRYVPARAVIRGDTVIVSSPQVPRPVAVRFGWADCPKVNLTDRQGLPASPFETDPLPAATMP